MSFVAPMWLAIAALVAVGVVIAHLITRSQPRREVLPTARFIPQTAPLTVTRTRRPSDLLLLLTRLLAVGLIGLAFARPQLTRTAPSRVIIADLSPSVADTSEVRDTIRALGGGDAIVVTVGDTASPATISGGLVAAHRALAARDNRERAELVIVSPMVRGAVDSATRSLLALWSGPTRVARVRARSSPTRGENPYIRGSGDDPVAASLAWSPVAAGGMAVRLLRAPAHPTAADSAWARDSAGAIVVWPADLAAADLPRRSAPDTVHGIAVEHHAVIASFARTHAPRAGRAIVRWIDGQPAAVERPLGSGCIREVAIPVDATGDVALRASFNAVVHAVVSPCNDPIDLAPADLASLLPTDDNRQQVSASVPTASTARLAAWLALAALAVLLTEQFLRRRQLA